MLEYAIRQLRIKESNYHAMEHTGLDKAWHFVLDSKLKDGRVIH